MANTTFQNTTLPYKVQRILSKYEPAIRAAIEQHLDAKAAERGGHDLLRLEDIGWAVSCALSDIANAKAATPRPDPRMVKMTLAACRDGRYKTAEDFINERKGRLARRAN